MDFAWSEEQQSAYAASVSFSQEQLNDGLMERDRDERFAVELWRRCAEFGVLGWCMPEEFGGAGRDLITAIRMLEGIGYGCRDNALTLGLNGQLWSVQIPLLECGSDDQRDVTSPSCCRVNCSRRTV